MNARAQFTRMQDSTQADWQGIAGEFMQFTQTLPDRVMAHLKLLDGDYGGDMHRAVVDTDPATLPGHSFRAGDEVLVTLQGFVDRVLHADPDSL